MPATPISTFRRTKRPFALLCSSALAGAMLFALSIAPAQAQSLPQAKGGAGSKGKGNGGNGGDGGNPGQAGQDGTGVGGGAGGAAGAFPGADGGGGVTGVGTGGGGGGGGGAHGGVLEGDPVGDMKGGNGGRGGSSIYSGGPTSAGGGGGGAGGDGAIFDGDPAATISIGPGITLSGGNGGAGNGAFGSAAGAGGAGLSFSGGTVINDGTLRGGLGNGTDLLNVDRKVGGNGLNFSGTRLENRGTIEGGLGSEWVGHPVAGDGGVGVSFTGDTVDNAGEIRGGDGGMSLSNGGIGGTGLAFAGRALANSGTIGGGNGGLVVFGGIYDTVGAGGVGLSFSGEMVTNDGTIEGGDGGGIARRSTGNDPTSGGTGGDAIVMGAGTLVNSATIAGGEGGGQVVGPFPPAPGTPPRPVSPDDGGNGGIGVNGTGARIFNSGAITGGSGGTRAVGEESRDGEGAAGIAGSNLHIVNSGTIAGGLSGDGSRRASAIVFTGGANRLELQAGWAIIGDVEARASGSNDRLVLGGAADSVFNVGGAGSAVHFRGFEHFEKAGAGTWTLTGTGAQNWAIGEGVLKGDADSLGGNLAFGTGAGTRAVIFDQSVNGRHAGTISGDGALIKMGAGRLTLANANSHAGGTTISDGTLVVETTGALGSGPVRIVTGGRLRFTRDASAESLDIALTAAALNFDDNASAGAATIVNTQGGINFGGTATAGAARIENHGGGTSFNRSSSAGNARIIVGANGTVDFYDNATAGSATILIGAVTRPSKSVVRFHGDNEAGSATIVNGAGAQVDVSDLTSGGIAIGSLSGDGAVYLGSKTLILGGLGKDDVIGGVIQHGGDVGGGTGAGGALIKTGAGTLTLNGANSHSGLTTVRNGTLIVGGAGHAGAALAGDVAVGADGALGGAGTIAGDVTVAGRLSPGNSPGTLTIGGDLSLAPGARLAFEFGQANVAGGALNDLVDVGGNLVLDGTLDVAVPAGGAFDIGVYRVFDYGGVLTDNGLDLGTLPADSHVTVQTSVAGQVNLVNARVIRLNFWDGAAGPKNDGIVGGGAGIWQASAGNDDWTDAAGLANAAWHDRAFAIFGGAAGRVTVDGALGGVSVAGMQFAADGYVIAGDGIALGEPQTVIRVGDGSVGGAGFGAVIDAALGGAAELVKTDAGTLVLGGTNSYTGGTLIQGGTIRIARDANLGAAAGQVTLDGGTLATSADIASDRGIVVAGTAGIATAAGTRFTLGGQLSGAGALTKTGAGTLRVTGDGDGFGGSTLVAAGTLAVDGRLGGAVTVGIGARIEGGGRVGSLVNAGVVAPGGGIGTLATAGDYQGRGGVIEIETGIETGLAGDVPVSDRLVVGGATSGDTLVRVTDRGGLGVRTVEGLRIVDVAGASNGAFMLDGDYLFDGAEALIAGAYGYRLVRNGVADPRDGDWYLRSSLAGAPGQGNPGPLYQPGVPVYEAYIGALQALNGVPTLQQRVGNRSWAGTPTASGAGIWGRFEAQRQRPEAILSSSAADRRTDGWQMHMGADMPLARRGDGAALIGGITAHYGKADTAVTSVFGNGAIDTKGYGVGATLTWYGPQGFYIDGQAKLSWFDSDLESGVLGTLVEGSKGKGRAFGIELGKRSPVGRNLTVTPQIQMIYAHVGFDRFADPAAAIVSAGLGDSLKTRWGVSLDHQQSQDAAGTHVYALVNLAYEWLDGAQVDVSGTPIRNRGRRLSGELGLGGSYSWAGGRFAVYAEAAGDTALADFGQGYTLKGTAGLRMRF